MTEGQKMPTRKIELPLEAIDEILALLGGLDTLGRQAIKRAEKKGFEIPEDVFRQMKKVNVAYKAFKKANDNVEIAELEEMFLLSFEENA
jgi:hypothetical protein